MRYSAPGFHAVTRAPASGWPPVSTVTVNCESPAAMDDGCVTDSGRGVPVQISSDGSPSSSSVICVQRWTLSVFEKPAYSSFCRACASPTRVRLSWNSSSK